MSVQHGMKNLRRIAALTAATMSAIAACGCAASQTGAGHRGQPGGRLQALTSSQVTTLRDYGTGDTEFGLSLLSALCRHQPGANVVLSPVSLATGLGMAYLGARGATATAMARVLHLPTAGPGLVDGLRARAALLRSLNRPGITFSTSNRIWADPSLSTNPRFAAELRAGYQAGLTHLPLLSRPEQARGRINSAIATDTRGHIKNLLPPDALSQPIGWMLTDALYLNASWARPFSHASTAPGPFAASGGRVRAEYLNGGDFATARANGWAAAALPYRGGRLSMLALLPPVGTRNGPGSAAGPGACQIPSTAALGTLAAKLAGSRTSAAVMLPKVSLAWTDSMRSVLTSLGMGLAFTTSADFSRISAQACCIGVVRHAATLSVAEKGTVASAATAVGMAPLAARVIAVLRFSRPYLLLIRDSLTGEPLMLAWVANPSRS